MGESELEEMKRQILLKQKLIDQTKNAATSGSSNPARRKSNGTTSTAPSNSNSVLKKQSAAQQQQTANSSTAQLNPAAMQQYITAQLYQSNKVNTHQLVKKFLKDRQMNTLSAKTGNTTSTTTAHSMLDCPTYKQSQNNKSLNYHTTTGVSGSSSSGKKKGGSALGGATPIESAYPDAAHLKKQYGTTSSKSKRKERSATPITEPTDEAAFML